MNGCDLTRRVRLAARPGVVGSALAGGRGLSIWSGIAPKKKAVVVANSAGATRVGCGRSGTALSSQPSRLGASLPRHIGIAVNRADGLWIKGYNQDSFSLQQGVSKLWVALAVFDAIDRGVLRLDLHVKLGRDDLTLFNQPLRTSTLEHSSIFLAVGGLLEHWLKYSDNTANNRLLRAVGGLKAVRRLLFCALAPLAGGDLLSSDATSCLLAIPERVKSGQHRLKGGVPPAWTNRHKTGTGQVLDVLVTVYNDVAIVESPQGTSYAITAMIRSTSSAISSRLQLMRAVTRTLMEAEEQGG